MSKIYEYIRHPRASELARLGRPIKTNDLRTPKSNSFFAKLNARFGLRITLVVNFWAGRPGNVPAWSESKLYRALGPAR